VKKKRMFILVGLLAMFIPVASAMAGDATPYVVGQWKLEDSFADFCPLTTAVTITPAPCNPMTTYNTEFNFQSLKNLPSET
jgi:hypothetical protein